MSTLAEFMIVTSADNRPPMLDKPQYESWKSRMELYIQGKDIERIILNTVENGPVVWPTIALENVSVRPNTYEELSNKGKLQADCDLKATNIVLQVENGPVVWPTIALENVSVRPNTYEELSNKGKLQADCDLKATNIVLQ
nr:hypothetical protein [Tanacetum cinerariifolium]